MFGQIRNVLKRWNVRCQQYHYDTVIIQETLSQHYLVQIFLYWLELCILNTLQKKMETVARGILYVVAVSKILQPLVIGAFTVELQAQRVQQSSLRHYRGPCFRYFAVGFVKCWGTNKFSVTWQVVHQHKVADAFRSTKSSSALVVYKQLQHYKSDAFQVTLQLLVVWQLQEKYI